MIETSESIANISAALSKAQMEIQDAGKDKQGYGYKYADLAQVLQIARPALSKNEIAIIQFASSDGLSATVETMFSHSSGEWMRGSLTMQIHESKNLTPAQCTGSVITYARRYSISAMVGIAQDDDDAAGNPSTLVKTVRKNQTTSVAKQWMEDNPPPPDFDIKEYSSKLKESFDLNDAPGANELWGELTNDEKTWVWTDLDSTCRRWIKENCPSKSAGTAA